MKMNKLAAALCAAASLPVAAAMSAPPSVGTFDDIKCWVGSGANRCAVVIDFNGGGAGACSFAWGYRWDGDAPSVKSILDEVTVYDKRLKMFASQSQYGTFVDAFAYDADGDGGTFRRVWNGETYAYDHVKSDADDIFPVLDSVSYVDEATGNYVYSGTSWMLLQGTGKAFEDVRFAESQNGVDLTRPADGEWICLRICTYFSAYDADWSFVSYSCDIDSDHVPVSAIPAPAILGFTVGATSVTVVTGSVIDGLYYGLSVSTDLADGFAAPTEWVRAENGRVVLEKAKNAAAARAFYKVRVSDVDETKK